MRRAPLVGLAIALASAVIIAQQSPAPTPRDPQRELTMSVADGFTVAVNDLTDDGRLSDLAERTGGLACAADISDPVAGPAMVRVVASRLGPVEVLVANAAAMSMSPFLESKPDEWWRQSHRAPERHRLRRVQGRADRPDQGPGPGTRTAGHPHQRDRAVLHRHFATACRRFRRGPDPGRDAPGLRGTDPGAPAGQPGRHRRGGGVPGRTGVQRGRRADPAAQRGRDPDPSLTLLMGDSHA